MYAPIKTVGEGELEVTFSQMDTCWLKRNTDYHSTTPMFENLC